MKRPALFLVFFVVLGGARGILYYAHCHEKQTRVSANAVVEMAADAQRDLSRAPMRLTRLSDGEEISIGRELSAR